MPQEYSHADLYRVAVREIGQRRRVYTNLKLAGKMTPEKADYEIGAMEAIAEHFRRLANEDAVRGDLFGKDSTDG